jgi:hypothetical protein
MDKKDKLDMFGEYAERIRTAPEQKIIRQIDSIRWSFRIFYGNHIELTRLLKVLEDKPESIKLWDVKKRGELDKVFEEIGRLLFNYLAAAFMLIDHTRRYVDKMHGEAKHSAFKAKYKKEVRERFTDSENHQIAKGLRNYIQHRNLPAVGSRLIYTQEAGLSKTFGIPIDSLLAWDGWSPLARKKLGAMGKSFKIRAFVEEYFGDVEAFHKWLWKKQVEMYGEDIERLNKLKDEARKFAKDAGIITEEEFKEWPVQVI